MTNLTLETLRQCQALYGGESDPYLRICIKGLLIFHGPDVGSQLAAAAPSEQYSIFWVDLYTDYL